MRQGEYQTLDSIRIIIAMTWSKYLYTGKPKTVKASTMLNYKRDGEEGVIVTFRC